MASNEILRYYDQTFDRNTRDDLMYSVDLVEEQKIAIDCGCGAGSDIAFLRSKGFRVYGFDIEKESIQICSERFKNDEDVILAQSDFNSYEYPDSSLFNADASLFFCPTSEFNNVWSKIYTSLCSGGIFCGSFLGPDDTMASSSYDKDAYWPNILVFGETDLKKQFTNFDILRFTEHRSSGHAPDGKAHEWHIYSVVAKKF